MTQNEDTSRPPDESLPADSSAIAESADHPVPGKDAPADDPVIDQATTEVRRRNFLVESLAAGVGALVSLVPVVLGGLFFLDPLIRKGKGKSGPEGEADTGATNRVEKNRDGFIRLNVTTDALPDDGTPVRYTVHDDIVNVWNKYPNQPIGSVWLRKIEGQVIAFSTICPHLGCAVEHRAQKSDFYCPCHTSTFTLNGEPVNDIPPRPMDELQVNIEDNRIWLKYQEFRGATSEKVLV